jgi:hypothetical protein
MQVRPGRGEFHENPAACICEKPEAKEKLRLWREQQAKKPKKTQAATEIKAQGPVIPLEDRIEEDEDEEVPLVIDDDQTSDETIEGLRDTEELLLESEGTNGQESTGEGADDDNEDGDNY